MSYRANITDTINDLVHRRGNTDAGAKWPTITIDSFEDFSHISAQFSHLRSVQEYIFRGQANSAWSLEPSLHRLFRSHASSHGLQKLDMVERLGERGFLERAYDYFKEEHLPPLGIPYEDSEANRRLVWSAMQHYGAPTRLLDWTWSMNVALYFACLTESATVDGAVWMTSALKSANDLASFLFSPTQSFSRSYSQKSVFSVFDLSEKDHAVPLAIPTAGGRERFEGPALVKLIIPARIKLDCAVRLHAATISGSTLFEREEGLCRSVKEQMSMYLWTGTAPEWSDELVTHPGTVVPSGSVSLGSPSHSGKVHVAGNH